MSQHDAPEFRKLQTFIGEQTAPKPRRKGPRPETANELTRRIINHLRAKKHFAARINVGGIYDDRLKKYRPSGTPSVADVIACVNGSFVGLEVKVGSDEQSDVQKHVEGQIRDASGYYRIVRTFADFEQFFNAITRPPFA